MAVDWLVFALLFILTTREFMDHEEKRLLREIAHSLKEIARCVCRLVVSIPTGGTISQIGEDGMPTNNSIPVGGSGVFQVTPTPPGSAVPAADKITFAASDPSIGIAASPDGDVTKAVVSVPAGSALTNFQLACQFTGPDFPNPVNATPITVSVTPAGPVLPTGGTIAQLS